MESFARVCFIKLKLREPKRAHAILIPVIHGSTWIDLKRRIFSHYLSIQEPKSLLFCSKQKCQFSKIWHVKRMIRKLYKWKKCFAFNLWKWSDSKHPYTKKIPARNQHWNGILAILLVERGITSPPQPIRMRVAKHLKPARLPFGLRKGTIWRGQFFI